MRISYDAQNAKCYTLKTYEKKFYTLLLSRVSVFFDIM